MLFSLSPAKPALFDMDRLRPKFPMVISHGIHHLLLF
jgi:hypothetical protein